MKKNFLSLVTGVTCLFVASYSFGSTFEVCKVTAKVDSIEEVSVFEKGSQSVPDGVNSDGKEVYTFHKLVTLDVLDVQSDSRRYDCSHLMTKKQKFVVDNKTSFANVEVGEELKLTRTHFLQGFPNGWAYSIEWKRT